MNYTSKHAVMGMLSSKYKVFDDFSGYQKNSKEIVLFTQNLLPTYENLFSKINLAYSETKNIHVPDNYAISSQYKSNMLVSGFSKDFFDLAGKKWIEIRETRNKYNKIVSVENEIQTEEIISFIDKWNELRGKNKYGWQLHSGYDKNFFQSFYAQEKQNLWCNFFRIDNELVGYSVISKLDNSGSFDYIIRKTRTDLRNICLYVDYKSFEIIHNDFENFAINWGCSKGSLLKYKEKFPVMIKEPRYFMKLKEKSNE